MTNDSYTVADAELMRSAIQRVATGPELSKNLSREETQAVMHALLDGSADPVQAAVFLIGLRMKRETEDEFKGVMDALQDRTQTQTADVESLVAIAEPYNGFNRTLQGSLFALPVLAACGIHCYSHGVEMVGPKFGVTHHAIIKALGGNPLRTTNDAAKQLSHTDIGWAYLDQSIMCPSLYSLNDLRERIVKRPVLSTSEGMICAIKGTQQTHLVTGYVHKPYRDTYCMLAKHLGYHSLLLVRGTEGGVVPSFRAAAHVVRYDHNVDYEELDHDLAPLDLLREYRAEDIPDSIPTAKSPPHPIGMKWDIDALAQLCAKRGREALAGKPGPIHDAAVLGAALVLWHCGHASDMGSAVEQARGVIASGEALRRLEAGL